MNCPGHCLIFKSKRRSYRDLPIRYADFGSLHRNETSGSLSGLTRVRRFHQDDGHIFCRPSQVEDEIRRTIDFVKVVYAVLGLPRYRFALSTRPADHYMGEVGEWDRAEAALRRVLDASGVPWAVSEGDGAFYGPKIDVVIGDSDGKDHQTATVQLDFQLPKRFGLEYDAPAPEFERRGESTDDAEALKSFGPVTPVLVHRAVLGSVERLMALLMEERRGKWPFWLNPRQAVIVTVNDSPAVVEHARRVRAVLTGVDDEWHRQVRDGADPAAIPAFRPTGLAVDIDDSSQTLGYKIRDAQQKGYGYLVVIGNRNVRDGNVTVGTTNMSTDELRDVMLNARETFQ
jgi:threonyl-tRNA synthetase